MKQLSMYQKRQVERILREAEQAEGKLGRLLIKLLAHEDTTPEQIAAAVAMTKRVSANMEALRASTHNLIRR